MNSPQDSWFNPTIYFACKLCRQSTRSVDELILHKRLKHTAEELREIKCIIFEERFLKTESEDALLDSRNFIKEDTSLSNSNTIISQLPKCNTADQYHNVNVGVGVGIKGNIKSQLTNSANSKIPYIFLKRLSKLEISSYSKRVPYKSKEDPRLNFANATNTSDIPYANVSQNLKYKSRPGSDNSINEGNTNCRNSKSCKQNCTAVPAPNLTDAQISRLIHNEEIVHLSMPFIRINRLPLSNQPKSNCDRNGEKESAGSLHSMHSIGTKRNSQPVFSKNSKIKAKPPKRCKITENDDNATRKGSGDENSDSSSDANEIQSSKSILSSSVSGDHVESNTDSDAVNNSKSDRVKDSQELEDGVFIVASIVVDCNGSEKVQFHATDTPITEIETEKASSAAVSISTGYECKIHSREQRLGSESAENSFPLNPGINELTSIHTHKEFILSSVGEHSHDETPSRLCIAEPDETTLLETENPHNDDELSDAADFHEDLVGDNEEDSAVIIDLQLDSNTNDEPGNDEPVPPAEDISPTEISNLHETVHEICNVLNPQEQEQPVLLTEPTQSPE